MKISQTFVAFSEYMNFINFTIQTFFEFISFWPAIASFLFIQGFELPERIKFLIKVFKFCVANGCTDTSLKDKNITKFE